MGDKILRYSGLAIILILLFGLGGWYFFLRSQGSGSQELASSRGFDVEIPSFSGSRGSTAANIESGFGTTSEQMQTNALPPRLWRVSIAPAAGLTFVGATTSARLRYVERSTGYLFEADPLTGKVVRITNTLQPKTYEALVQPGFFIARGLDEAGIATAQSSKFTASTTDGFRNLAQTNLPSDIQAIAASSTGVLYVLNDASGKALFIRANSDGTNPKQIFSFGISGWNMQWLEDDRIIISERPASNVATNAFELTKKGTLAPIVETMSGLTLLPKAYSGALLYGSDTGSSLALYARASSDANPVALPIHTVTDKCVWARGKEPSVFCAVPKETPPANFLDSWYQGRVHTADNWWKLDVSTGKGRNFFTTNNVALDVQNPIIDTEGKYLAWIDAADKSLWILRLSDNTEKTSDL